MTPAFPSDFSLAVSMDGRNWEILAEIEGDDPMLGCHTIYWGRFVEARYFRVQITRGSGWDRSDYGLGCDVTAIGEIELYGVPMNEIESETERETETEWVGDWVNVALGATASATVLDDGNDIVPVPVIWDGSHLILTKPCPGSAAFYVTFKK